MIFVRAERPDLKRGMTSFYCKQNQTLVCRHEVGQRIWCRSDSVPFRLAGLPRVISRRSYSASQSTPCESRCSSSIAMEWGGFLSSLLRCNRCDSCPSL
jgi:hypothetical protein